MFAQKSLSLKKNISKEKIRRPVFVVYVLICPLSKFGDNRTNSIWVLAFYSVCFHWKKIDSRNSTNYVNQTGNFYFRPKLKTAISLPIYISNLFQWFLFYIRDFIWIITLTEKKIVDLKVYCNLNFPSPKARPLESDNLRSTAVRKQSAMNQVKPCDQANFCPGVICLLSHSVWQLQIFYV